MILRSFTHLSLNLPFALQFALQKNVEFTDEEKRIIFHCRKSLLFYKNKPWKKKDSDSCFHVTMGSYHGRELCEFIGIYLLSKLCTIISKNGCGLYRDDGSMIQEYISGQQIDQLRKKIIKIFKEIGFKIDIETNFKIVNLLDMTFNLINGSYKPSKKPNDTLLYINKNANLSPQIIKKLPKNNQRQIVQKFFKCRDFSCIKNRIWKSIEEQWV